MLRSPSLAELPEELLGSLLGGVGQHGESAAGQDRLAVGVECDDSGHLPFSRVSMMRSNDHPR